MSRTPVPLSSAGPRQGAAGPGGGDRAPASRAVTAVIVAATLVGLGLRIYQLIRPGYLLGITEYDDGTDYGSAVRLIHGTLPYRDFIMVQPTGITVLMAPVALATKAAGTVAGMAVARVLTALAGTAAIGLGGLLTRHRGFAATAMTCGILAVFPDSLQAARTVLLEPWLVLFCLLGALAVFDGDRLATRKRLIWGGLAFGFAGAVKVWAILPVLVLLAITAWRRPRDAAGFGAGVAAGFCLPVLPFALLAPVTFYRSVIVAQLVRSDLVRIPAGFRLQHMLGLNHLPQLATPALVVIGAAVIVLIAALSVLGWRLTRQPPPPLDWFATVTFALVVVAFLWPSDFYNHYAAFLAPFLALAIALPLSRVLAALPPAGARARAGVVRTSAAAVTVAAVAVFAVVQGVSESHLAAGIPASEILAARQAIPPGACVVSDTVSYTIAINRFVASSPGCSPMVDGVGSDYALSSGRNGLTGAGAAPAVEQMWLSAFRGARYVWLTSYSTRRVPWTPRLRAYFLAHFAPLIEGPDWLYTRTR